LAVPDSTSYGKNTMTDRQQAVVAHYLGTLHAAEAARRAGYSARVSDREGYRLLRNAEIQTTVQEGRAKLLADAELTAQRVLEEIRPNADKH
jgi:phage terminase small subunit